MSEDIFEGLSDIPREIKVAWVRFDNWWKAVQHCHSIPIDFSTMPSQVKEAFCEILKCEHSNDEKLRRLIQYYLETIKNNSINWPETD